LIPDLDSRLVGKRERERERERESARESEREGGTRDERIYLDADESENISSSGR
jgi:hypothetical protein